MHGESHVGLGEGPALSGKACFAAGVVSCPLVFREGVAVNACGMGVPPLPLPLPLISLVLIL